MQDISGDVGGTLTKIWAGDGKWASAVSTEVGSLLQGSGTGQTICRNEGKGITTMLSMWRWFGV